MLWVFYQTLDNYEPKLQKDSSYIGHNPGLGYRPMLTKENPYSSLLWFKHGASGNWDRFKENLDEFLVEYEPGYWANAGAVLTKCFFSDGPLSKEKTCEFNKANHSERIPTIRPGGLVLNRLLVLKSRHATPKPVCVCRTPPRGDQLQRTKTSRADRAGG